MIYNQNKRFLKLLAIIACEYKCRKCSQNPDSSLKRVPLFIPVAKTKIKMKTDEQALNTILSTKDTKENKTHLLAFLQTHQLSFLLIPSFQEENDSVTEVSV